MIAVYLGIGLLILLTDNAINMFPNYRKELGCTMIIYAVVRSFLMIRKHKKDKKNEF